MKNYLLFLFFLSILNACSSNKEESKKGAWLGGEIINPNSDFVILTKNKSLIDTIYLDENNRFNYYISDVEKGIYNLVHNEYQILYLEPGDSLLLRLNTIEFDESLAYTGIGSERNNFLISTFLYNEKENQRMRPYYDLPVELFLQKLDSMRNLRQEKLQRFSSKYKPCSDFNNLAESNILYDYFSKLEIYPYAHFGRNNIKLNELPENYYDFRKQIDYNNAKLQSHYSYYRFLLRHFDNLAHSKYNEALNYDSNLLIHITEKLKAIDSLVSHDEIKNNLMRSSIRNFVINCKNPDDEREALSVYYKLSTDELYKEEISALAKATLEIMPGKKLPELNLFDINNEVHSFNSIIEKPTILYFWSEKSVNHFKNIHSKVLELRQKYPEFNFIALYTDDNVNSWKKIIANNGFNNEFEYRFENPSHAIEKLVLSSINKTFIISSDNIIIDNNSNLFSHKFEEQLLGLLNQ